MDGMNDFEHSLILTYLMAYFRDDEDFQYALGRAIECVSRKD